MRNRRLIARGGIMALGLSAAALAPRPAAAAAFSARYSEAANVFNLLDCVSGWTDDYCLDKGAYRRDFEKRTGALTAEDRTLFARYAQIRGAHVSDMRITGLFASPDVLDSDRLGEAFYASKTLEQAYAKLAAVVSPEEAAFLRGFYAHFAPRTRPYVVESAPFARAAEARDAKLSNPAFYTYFKEVSRFYGVSAEPKFTALLLWWPPLDRDNAVPSGEYLLMRLNPRKHLALSDEDVFFHEIVHTISARQSDARKRALTEAFRSRCAAHVRPDDGYLLEEPLAVALGQMEFLRRFDPEGFKDNEGRWYANPWVERFSVAIDPLVRAALESGGRLDEDLARRMGDVCARLQPFTERRGR